MRIRLPFVDGCAAAPDVWYERADGALVYRLVLDWDNPNERPTTEEVYRLAPERVAPVGTWQYAYPEPVVPNPPSGPTELHVGPTPDGGIQVEWNHDGRGLELHAPGPVRVVVDDHDKIVEEVLESGDMGMDRFGELVAWVKGSKNNNDANSKRSDA